MSITEPDPSVEPGGDSEEALFLPPPSRNARTTTSNKQLYKANALNLFPYVDAKGIECMGYARLGPVRVINLSGRIQETRGQNWVATSMGIVFDDEEIGKVIDLDKGVFEPHPLYGVDRYAKFWNDRTIRPHRIRAQQWVNMENVDLLQTLVNHANTKYGWRVIQHPAQREGRGSRDLFLAIPPNTRDDSGNYVGEITDSGMFVESFEISTNDDYAEGFFNFMSALDEQLQRWLDASAIETPELKTERLHQIADNLHYVCGVSRNANDEEWARPTDVGLLTIDGIEFPLYQAKGTKPLDLDIFAPYVEANKRAAINAATAQISTPDLAAMDLSRSAPNKGF